MTISAVVRDKTNSGDGSTQLFAVPFQFRSAADLRVTLIDSDASETVLTLNVHYTVSGGGSPPASGNVTMLTAPATGQKLLIEGNKAIAQQRSYAAGGRFPAESHEGALDDLTIFAQEVRRDVLATGRRAQLVPRGEVAPAIPAAEERAGKFRAWDADGNEIATSSTGSGDAALREDLAADGGAGLVNFQASETGSISASIATELRSRQRSIMRFIPYSKHNLIYGRGLNPNDPDDDLADYFQLACLAVNNDIVNGEGPNGVVEVPHGLFPISRSIGIRNTVIRGPGFWGGCEIVACGTGTGYMFDATLDRDGVTPNTVGAGGVTGVFMRLTGSGFSGVSTYGGFAPLSEVYILGAVNGFNIGLPIGMVADHLYSKLHTGVGLHTYSGEGDVGTTLTINACWMEHALGDIPDAEGYNYHLEQITACKLYASASQNSPSGGIGLYAEGSTGGAGVGSSIEIDVCDFEIEKGTPIYLKNQRGIILNSPKIVEPPARDALILDNASGDVNCYQAPIIGGGGYGMRVINLTDSPGSVVALGGDFTMPTDEEVLVTAIGASINGFRRISMGGTTRGIILAPAPLAATVTDYAIPSGVGVLKLTPATGGTTINSFAGGYDGRTVLIQNVSATPGDTITLANAGPTGTPGNKFALPSGTSVVIPHLGSAVLWYDAKAVAGPPVVGYWRQGA